MTKASRIIIWTALALLAAADAGAAGVRILSSGLADGVANLSGPDTVTVELNSLFLDAGLDSAVFSGEVTAAALGEADLLVAILPEDDFTGDEVNAMAGFLAAGNRIMFLGERDNNPVPNDRINDALLLLGSTLELGGASIDSGFNDIFVDDGQILANSLTVGVEHVNYGFTNEVLGAAADERLFLTQNLANVWGAAQTLANGLVVVLGDSNILSQLAGPNANDNALFFTNVATIPLPPALLGFLPALAGLLAARRR